MRQSWRMALQVLTRGGRSRLGATEPSSLGQEGGMPDPQPGRHTGSGGGSQEGAGASLPSLCWACPPPSGPAKAPHWWDWGALPGWGAGRANTSEHSAFLPVSISWAPAVGWTPWGASADPNEEVPGCRQRTQEPGGREGCGPTVCSSTLCVCLVSSVHAHCTAEGTGEQSDPGKEGALNPCPVEQEHRQAWAGSPLTACSELGSPQTPAPELAYSGVLGPRVP